MTSSPDDIVAELNFGFWVGLMGPSYDATLWRQTLYKSFLASGGQKRSIVHGRFNVCADFAIEWLIMSQYFIGPWSKCTRR